MKIKLPPRKFSESIKINCNKKTVYDILGNSKNVRKWSVYVHHIKPINKITGGKLGSRRRCYRNKDESNMRWDEEVILDKKYQTRRLSIYNLSGFLLKINHLFTEQIYKKAGPGKTLLTFTVFLDRKKSTVLDILIFNCVVYKIKSVFRKNLENIKHLAEPVERKKRYQRIYPFY